MFHLIERAGVEIKSITEVVNFQVKYDMVESKAKAVLLPGFQIMDMGYQTDGSYQVVLSGKVQTATAQQPSEEDKLQSLKNDINGTWQLKVSDQPNVQFVSITHYLQFGINPPRKEANLLAECNHNTDAGVYYNGKLSQVGIKIDNATYCLDGSITSDGKRILGSFEKHYTINWEFKKSNGTFEMVRQ